MSERIPEADVDPMFPGRWSPRAFLPEPIPETQLRSLFEAARWAPSSGNEQPWLFVYATSVADRERFATALNDGNRRWAPRAPVLLYVCARRHWTRNGTPNRTYQFDSGAAWASLALQAQLLGLSAHGMAGFDQHKAHEILGVPEDTYEVIAAVALGKRADASTLPPDLAAREGASGRKPLAEVAVEGAFPARKP